MSSGIPQPPPGFGAPRPPFQPPTALESMPTGPLSAPPAPPPGPQAGHTQRVEPIGGHRGGKQKPGANPLVAMGGLALGIISLILFGILWSRMPPPVSEITRNFEEKLQKANEEVAAMRKELAEVRAGQASLSHAVSIATNDALAQVRMELYPIKKQVLQNKADIEAYLRRAQVPSQPVR